MQKLKGYYANPSLEYYEGMSQYLMEALRLNAMLEDWELEANDYLKKFKNKLGFPMFPKMKVLTNLKHYVQFIENNHPEWLSQDEISVVDFEEVFRVETKKIFCDMQLVLALGHKPLLDKLGNTYLANRRLFVGHPEWFVKEFETIKSQHKKNQAIKELEDIRSALINVDHQYLKQSGIDVNGGLYRSMNYLQGEIEKRIVHKIDSRHLYISKNQ